MSDREKVVKGLECCTAELGTNQHRDDFCQVCPYRDKNPDMWYCFHQQDLMRDAIALLKAQEPRVIPRDAIQASTGAPVWFESRNGRVYTGWALAYDIQLGQGITGERLGVTQPGGHVLWVKLDDYGKSWRCWTSRPDEKRRAETPWERSAIA